MERDANELRLEIKLAREELAAAEAKRDALDLYVDGLQAMLDFILSQSTEANGVISVRDAVFNVFQVFPGNPMSSGEIAAHADWESTGSRAKDRTSAVDGAVLGLIKRGEPIEKAGPRTWVWVGDPKGLRPGGSEVAMTPLDLAEPQHVD
ncbi:MAG: hypothetical protein OXM03_03225 [Chloroflexota bacterium]|nr:hypothetical protein [Chloroflexota bacterium]MDE2839620.1 hypothetical protein [Chloroflexota bacterium]MDE2931309.1 hypothetical protein [Chloroflexota bacterium]